MSNDPALASFDGRVRLFPLPNLVLFPSVLQGLHLFEPRYRQLAADSIATDGTFAMAVLKPGWEGDYEGMPALEPVACLGHILQHEKLPDGRYNMKLRGVTRVKLFREIETDAPYRMAEAIILSDDAPAKLATLSGHRKALAAAVLARFEPDSPTHKQLTELFSGEATLGQVCDVISYALPMSAEFKYQLLAEPRVSERVAMLVHAMTTVRKQRKFPPEFSIN